MPERPDEFYVGYLPMPAGHLRWVRIGVPATLWILVACSATIAYFQRSPGDAQWDQGSPVQRTGVLWERPYPHLILDPGETTPVFLVEQGKHGSAARCRGLEGSRVRVTGWRLDRDGREVIELVPEPGAVERLPDTPAAPYQDRERGPVSLWGEIVDYKCFLGAMKPGDGKAHKACAALCIDGGIPPVLVMLDVAGNRHYTLLASADGGPMGVWASEFAGEPVRVVGRMHEVGSLEVLWVDSVSRDR